MLAIASSLIYLFTAAPFMLWLDAPRFVSAIVTLGIANPPEPLYIMLVKFFTYIPFGSYIFRIQIFSALTAALVLIVIYKLMIVFTKELLKPLKEAKLVHLTGLFSMLMLAFSYQFWSQAQNVENFILVTLIAVSVLYLLITADTKKKFFINFCLIAGVLGLATGTNPVIASIIPTILWGMWHKRKFWSISGFAVWIAVGVIGIIGVHLYIPIRASANPFLNYWRATTLENVIAVSTGSGLNVFVPELGRINGFTGSPEIFFKSTWHFIELFFIKFTPLLIPFIIAGGYFLWKKNQYYFIFWGLIIFTNWFFSSLYFSGNQESWFLMSDIAWVIWGGLGFYYLVSEGLEVILGKFKLFKTLKSLNKYKNYLFVAVCIPFFIWLPFLWRREWVVTEDYIKNLYRPIGEEKAIMFGSSDLYDSISFYVHDIPGTSVYKPSVIPITDNLLYILSWYRENLKSTTDLKIPDDKGLKYDSALEYSQFVMDFFEKNMDKYKIYITVPALRNNFLQAYKGQNLGPSLRIDEKRFKLIPQGMLMQLVPKDSTASANLANFEYQFKNKGFPKKQPFLLEQTYKTELTGVLNEYAYSMESLGDNLLKEGKADQALKYYQGAFDFNPKNAEIISRLGNYYGTIGDHQKAAEYFEKALKIEPNNVGLLFNSAIAYENTGRADKAMKNYNKVLQFSKGQEQIGQLAQVRLNALKQATPSAQTATAAGSIQQQLLTVPTAAPGVYQSRELNIQFVTPPDFKVTPEAGGALKMTNNGKGKDELTMTFYSRSLKTAEELESLATNLPFSVDGPILITQPVTIPGFQAIGKTIATGEHLTFLLLMKKENLGIAIKIYPGDSNKSDQLNQILGSINTL